MYTGPYCMYVGLFLSGYKAVLRVYRALLSVLL